MDAISQCMQMTSFGGESKSLSLLAIKHARERNFALAEQCMKKSAEALEKSHQAHTNLLSYDAEAEDLRVTIFMVHAADHLTAAEVIHTLAEELIYLNRGVGNV